VTAGEAANFQRAGSISNAHAGSDFEQIAARKLLEADVPVKPNIPVDVGVGATKKAHRFDLGSEAPPVIVECKSHTWTSGGNMPSAKITVWNEAMYYFSLAPTHFRKIFFVLKDVRRQESLAEYYVRLYRHLIPTDVEIWEYCAATDQVVVIHQSERSK
jgi:hypothetical protein